MRPVVKFSVWAALLASVGLAGGAVMSSFAVLTVHLPAAYTGWVLLVPSLHAPAGEPHVFVPDANGVCLMDTALIRKTVKIRLLQRGQNVEDATVYTGLVEGVDEQHRSYKYFQLYLPDKTLWQATKDIHYWIQQSFELDKKRQHTLDSLKRTGRMLFY